jgi:kumamolisin
MVISKNLKSLSGSERSPLKNAKEIGIADPNEIVEVTIVLRSKKPGAAAQSFRAISAKPLKERKYLSRDEFAETNAPDPADIAKIEEFAHEHGLTIVKVSPESSSISLSGTVAALSEAFGTKLSIYDSPKGKYRGRVGPVQVPADLSRIIIGVFGLDDRHVFKPHFVRLGEQAEKKGSVVKARAVSVSYTPPQLAKLYDFPTEPKDSNQCIAIVELGGGYKAKDLNAYFKELGMSSPKISAISVDHAQNKPGSDADGEVVLDIEVAGGIAPKAKIAVYFAPNTDKGFIDAINGAIHDKMNKPTVISISWGAAEKEWTPQAMQAMDQAFQGAATLGITVLCAAGDDGSSDNEQDNLAHVDFPASSPFATGCGGTRLDASQETVWNDGPGSSTGGGISDFFPLPDWQKNAGIPASSNPDRRIGRGVPDIAGDASPNTGYVVLLNGQKDVFGGTSAVAPLWSGLIAILNEKLGKPVGYLNPLFYNHYDQMANSGALRDIIDGNNGAYKAGPGWDPCTGLGVPDGAKLLQVLSNL